MVFWRVYTRRCNLKNAPKYQVSTIILLFFSNALILYCYYWHVSPLMHVPLDMVVFLGSGLAGSPLHVIVILFSTNSTMLPATQLLLSWDMLSDI